jgi:tetratricopeptide (TPR) repeat protein
MQGLVRSLELPPGIEHAIGSERWELRKAEDLFRRALAAQPAFLEARLRLGRVLHRLGRHDLAARELRQAARALPPAGGVTSDDDRLLAYYLAMFLGAAEETLGRHAQARASYERAAELFPAAPTPHLALSRVALSTNDRAGAIAAAREALLDQEREDPWWRYHVVKGRRVEGWFDAFRRSVPSGP